MTPTSNGGLDVLFVEFKKLEFWPVFTFCVFKYFLLYNDILRFNVYRDNDFWRVLSLQLVQH